MNKLRVASLAIKKVYFKYSRAQESAAKEEAKLINLYMKGRAQR